MSTATEVDPWADPEFGSVDFKVYREDKELEPDFETPMIQPDFGTAPTPAEIVATPEPEPEPAPAPIAVEVEPEGPEVIDLGDGSRIEIEKSSKGWKASLLTGTGGAENFYGKTKNELILNIATGKLNATKKIRELNKQVKLGTGKESPVATTRPVVTAPRKLTADEIFAIKTKFESNPDEALDDWFRARTGKDVATLSNQADNGDYASTELKTEATNKIFLARHPDYYPDEAYENFNSLVAYLAKHKLGTSMSARNKEELYSTLQSDGHWNVQNLDEAFEELKEAGLLVNPPQRPEVTPAPQQAAPTPAPAPLPVDPRIVSRTVQPRAGLGLRQTEATPVRPEAPKPPSVDDLDNLTDAEIAALYQQTLRAKRMQGRR